MSLLIELILLFVLINTFLKLSFWKWWQMAIVGVVLGAFILMIYPVAIEQSQVGLQRMLADVAIRQNITVLLCIETIAYFGFGFLSLEHLYRQRQSHWLYRILKFYPGLLILPTIFYLFTQVIFAFPGADFWQLAVISAIAVALIAPALSFVFKKLLPEKEFRLEILFVSGAMVLALGLISTYNGSIVYKSTHNTDFNSFLLGMSLIVGIAGTGYLANRIFWRFKGNKL